MDWDSELATDAFRLRGFADKCRSAPDSSFYRDIEIKYRPPRGAAMAGFS